MLRLAAEYGDAWIPTVITPEEYSEGVKRLAELRQEFGKSGNIYGALQVFDPPDTSGEALTQVEAFAEAGCDEYGVVWSYPPDEALKRIDWFAKEVIGL